MCVMVSILSAGIIVLAVTLFVRPNPTAPAPRVEVEGRFGKVLGVVLQVENRNVNVFNGVPFAEPPVGALRFGLPIRKQQVSAVTVDAELPSKPCVQNVPGEIIRGGTSCFLRMKSAYETLIAPICLKRAT